MDGNYVNGNALELNTESSGIDTCGYQSDMIFSVDTRNLKWQARQNGESTAASNKSYNHKDQAKYQKRRQAKMEREQHKAQSENMIKQMEADNKNWAPVDQEDARQMQRDAKKRQQE